MSTHKAEKIIRDILAFYYELQDPNQLAADITRALQKAGVLCAPAPTQSHTVEKEL